MLQFCFCFFTGKAFQSNQIDDLEKILFLEEFQQIHAERMTQIKHYRFASLNEITDLKNDHQ